MSASFGFRPYPRDAVLTLEQRAYVVRMLHLGASNARRTAVIDALGSENAAVREWKGIERACDREGRRLARLHYTHQAQGGAA